MTMLRSVGAVLAGYAIFAVSAFALFAVTGQDPHAPASLVFMAMTVVIGDTFAMIGGYVAGWLAGRRPLAHGVAVAVVIAVGAAVSLVATLGHGSVWTQIAALLFMAPGAVVGGWVRGRQIRTGR
jgi:hypothetical protein